MAWCGTRECLDAEGTTTNSPFRFSPGDCEVATGFVSGSLPSSKLATESASTFGIAATSNMVLFSHLNAPEWRMHAWRMLAVFHLGHFLQVNV